MKCPRCGGLIKWSDAKSRFVCPKHGGGWHVEQVVDG